MIRIMRVRESGERLVFSAEPTTKAISVYHIKAALYRETQALRQIDDKDDDKKEYDDGDVGFKLLY